MTRDVLVESGYLFLGTRMKRLAERLQADATRLFEAAGHGDLLPAFNAILFVLDQEGALSIGEISERVGISQPAVTRTVSTLAGRDLVRLEPSPQDQRLRIVHLTDQGCRTVARLKGSAWLTVGRAAENLCREAGEENVLETLGALEAALAAKGLPARTQADAVVDILDYRDDLASDFYRLNAEWIEDMFVMEASDEEVLSNPKTHIIDKGGDILFVRAGNGEIIGTGALQPVGDDGEYEFTKMAVTAKHRGHKAGEKLLLALIERAREKKVPRLHLLTNSKNKAAIHLYEKFGFRHDADVLKTFGAKYDRADIGMRYPI